MAGADATTTRGFSWVFHAAGAPLCRVEWEAPTADIVSNLRPGELLVALCAATICGSDIHTIDGVRSDPAAPLVLGHEGVGRICALGPNPPPGSANNSSDEHERQPAALGDMITWGIAASCGACVACTDWGLPQKCSHVVKYGHAPWRYDAHASEGTASSSSSVRSLLESLSGCYSTHIVLRRGSAVVRLPEGLPFAIAAPINCALATAVAAVAPAPPSVLIPRAAPLQPPPVGACWIQGAGMLGLWATALAKYVRCARLIVVTDVSAARLATAVSFGADVTVCTAGLGTTEALVKTVQAAVATAATPSVAIATAPVAAVTAGAAPSSLQFPFDLVVEACGAASVVPAGIALVRPGGEYVFVGMVHPRSALDGVTGESVIRKCLTIRGVHNYRPGDLDVAVAFMHRMAQQRGRGQQGPALPLLPLGELMSSPVPLHALDVEGLPAARAGTFSRVLLSFPSGER